MDVSDFKEIIMTNATIVKDPVCGMEVDSAAALGHSVHNGVTYYFCGTKCKNDFDLNPKQYLHDGPTSERQIG